MKKTNNILWGIVFIVVGLIFGLNALEITNINIFFDGWWTLFIIVPSFIDLFTSSSKTGAIVGLFIGVFLLLACQDIVDFVLVGKLAVPAILVIVGLSFIFRDTINKKVKDEIKKLSKNSMDEHYATFSTKKINVEEEFKGCEVNAVFGGYTLDLTKASFNEDTVINANAIFGGITIYTKDDINVKVSSTPIFGGVSNEIKNKSDNKVTLYINAVAVFGGIEIK